MNKTINFGIIVIVLLSFVNVFGAYNETRNGWVGFGVFGDEINTTFGPYNLTSNLTQAQKIADISNYAGYTSDVEMMNLEEIIKTPAGLNRVRCLTPIRESVQFEILTETESPFTDNTSLHQFIIDYVENESVGISPDFGDGEGISIADYFKMNNETIEITTHDIIFFDDERNLRVPTIWDQLGITKPEVSSETMYDDPIGPGLTVISVNQKTNNIFFDENGTLRVPTIWDQ